MFNWFQRVSQQEITPENLLLMISTILKQNLLPHRTGPYQPTPQDASSPTFEFFASTTSDWKMQFSFWREDQFLYSPPVNFVAIAVYRDDDNPSAEGYTELESVDEQSKQMPYDAVKAAYALIDKSDNNDSEEEINPVDDPIEQFSPTTPSLVGV